MRATLGCKLGSSEDRDAFTSRRGQRCLSAFLFCAVFILNATVLLGGTAETNTSLKPAKYVLRLNLNEFSILNVSEMDGLLKYGGSGNFNLNMAREGTNEVVWTVTIDNPRLMELLGIFVGERTVKLVQTIDPNNLEPNQKIALDAIKSLSQKLEYAQKHPVWDSLKLSGAVVQQGTNWLLQTKDGSFKLTGEKLDEIKSRGNGKTIVAEGFIKQPGQFELIRFLDKKTNTLELFVMSHCPFGQRAETDIYNFLERTNTSPKPKLEIRYLFYQQKKDGKDVFNSLHGEEEITENLVQMVIRDKFPGILKSYIHLRAASGKLPWGNLAEQSGLARESIVEIEGIITSQREALIQKEYDYVAGQHEITDGSPSYVWESEKVTDLNKIEAFRGMSATPQQACSQ